MPHVPTSQKENRSLLQEAIHSIGYYSLPLLLRVPVNILVVPIYTRLLTPADFGVLEILDVTSSVASILLGSNLGVALFYFYAKASDEERKRKTMSTALLGALGITVAAALILWPAAGPVSLMAFDHPNSYVGAVRLLFVSLALNIPAEMGLACLRAQSSAKQYAILSIFRIFGVTVLNIILIAGFGQGYMAMLISTTIINATVSAIILLTNSRTLRGGVNLPLLWSFIKYSWPLNIASLGVLLLTMGDRYILQRFVPLADLGVYSLAYKFGFIVSSVSLVFNQYWKPKMFVVMKQQEGRQVFARTLTYYSCILVWTALALTILLRPLVRLGTGAAFHDAVLYIPWFSFIFAVRGIGEFLRNTFYLIGRTHIEAWLTWLGSGLSVAGYLFLIPTLGLKGGIASSGITFIILLVLGWHISQRSLHIPIEYARILKLMLAATALVVIYLLVEPANLGFQLLLATIICVAFPALLWSLSFFELEEKAHLKGAFARIRALL